MRSHTNMTMDANKAITAIEYNALNLPRRVTFADGHITKYLYDAAGEKRQTKYLVDNRTVFAAMTLGETGSDEVMESSDSTAIETLLTRDYCGDYIYSDGSLERIMTINGYYSGSSYAYFVRDYQGNVVKLISASRYANWSQYYPYGGLFPDYTVNRYLYSSKELDKTNGLYLYDFHARHYDPMLARFTSIDPLCEIDPSISPYAYCRNNPIRNIDPTGKFIVGANGLRVQYNQHTGIWKNSTPEIVRMGNAMMKVSIGEKQLNEMLKSNFPIEIKFSNYFHPDGNNVLGLTEQALIKKSNGNGNTISIKQATITIYLPAIERMVEIHNNDNISIINKTESDIAYDNANPTAEEVLGAVSVHESVHSLDNQLSDREKRAISAEIQYLIQIIQQKNRNEDSK